jgi:aryl-alcohol dehydrogenase-like predicted oxidoreductase
MIPRAPFGSTGHESSRAIFGAAALGSVSHADAERTLELLLAHGVNHIDVAASYGDAELRLATWLKRNPGTFFIATKTEQREYKSAKEQFYRSLERLGVDRVDLLQLHNLVDPVEWETALRAEGALEAAIEARDEGLLSFIGVTGHGLSIAAMHRRSLDRFPFDSVLLPYNYRQMQDTRYAAEFESLVATCVERGVAIQTIKSIALGPWNGRAQTTATWYEPLTDPSDIDLAVDWVLGRDGVFLNTVGDVNLLPHVLEAAENFSGVRPTDEEMSALVERRSVKALFV